MGVNTFYLGSKFLFHVHLSLPVYVVAAGHLKNKQICPRPGGAVSGQELPPLCLNNGFHDLQMSRLL